MDEVFNLKELVFSAVGLAGTFGGAIVLLIVYIWQSRERSNDKLSIQLDKATIAVTKLTVVIEKVEHATDKQWKVISAIEKDLANLNGRLSK